MTRQDGEDDEKKPKQKKLTRAERSALNKAAYAAARSTEKLQLSEPHEGRSVVFSHDLADAIVDRVSGGQTLKEACRELNVCERTVRIWILDDRGADSARDPPVPGMATLMQRAELLQCDAWADAMIEIADECTDDTATRDKMRIMVRQYLMSKKSARYHDKSTTVLETAREGIRVIHEVRRVIVDATPPARQIEGTVVGRA